MGEERRGALRRATAGVFGRRAADAPPVPSAPPVADVPAPPPAPPPPPPEPAPAPEPPPAPPTSPPLLGLAEFHRRYAAGELSLERWEECCLAEDGLRPPDIDPRSPAYADAVLATWRAISGRAAYRAEHDEVFELTTTGFIDSWPYRSQDPTLVARYTGVVAAALDRLGLRPPARVVELGTGAGHLAVALAATGFEVTAVDISPGYVELLRTRAAALGLGPRLEIVQAAFLDYAPPAPVDAFVFFEAFHHCERPLELLDRCRAALRPGGRLLFIAEAIYDDFYVPWGHRLDGAAAYRSAQRGWLELGFRRDFFTAELEARGFTVTWELLPHLDAFGTIMLARL